MKRNIFTVLKHLPAVAGVIFCIIGLLIYPMETAKGIKNALVLIADNLIPSLFPFIVLSAYLVNSPVSDILAKVTNKLSVKLFKTNGYGMCAVIMGVIGGYPVGAKTVADFYECGKISKKQAQSLLLWCVNPGPAFVIIAVGAFMYNRIKSGIILYISIVLGAFVTGIVISFFTKDVYTPQITITSEKSKNTFVESVTSASQTMLSICSWVVVFSATGAVLTEILPQSAATFFQAFAEVTTGCRTAAQMKLPLPVTCGILSFGGFAVFFQIMEYLHKCSSDPKLFLCTRLINGALSAFICSELLKIFPEAIPVSASVTVNNVVFPLYHSLSSAIILIFMFILFILEVDNKKKVC